ncbi:type II toxin-antitoxin system VapC family toxin [Candidatus Acetothermia bacterium]|nr:type II toxin-antitoxin system VapC family toxin [Candidatus Acetothermia bacterium]
MSYSILVDTSAFHALQNTGDVAEHETARAVAERLQADRTLLVTTDYILDETYTLLRSVLGHKPAVAFGKEIQRGGIEIVQLDPPIQEEAWDIFERYSDKNFSYTDCTSFVVMRRAKIETAFTFDRHFQQYGFRTLPEKLWRRRK